MGDRTVLERVTPEISSIFMTRSEDENWPSFGIEGVGGLALVDNVPNGCCSDAVVGFGACPRFKS